ncbi:hypothetical protein HDV00_012831 [Rhizophlyctis rosea]|nr:hypothetical protein HDV00_012831 [Rhizophlyctis rosea]
MKVTILGSTRPIGAHATKLALERGHSVTLLTRSGESEFKTQAKVTVVKGDATKEEDLKKVTEGADGVLSFLGGKYSNSVEVLPNARFGKAITKVLPPTIPLITISNIGTSEASLELQPWWYRKLAVPFFMKNILADKRSLETSLRSSPLEKWVALRAATLSDGASSSASKIKIIEDETSPEAVITASTKRGDIAVVALDILEGKTTGVWGKAINVIST